MVADLFLLLNQLLQSTRTRTFCLVYNDLYPHLLVHLPAWKFPGEAVYTNCESALEFAQRQGDGTARGADGRR